MDDLRPFLRRRPDGRCRLMGILNITPDSFHAASRVDVDEAVERGLEMWSAGADWVDVGGELNGESAMGRGQVLTGGPGASSVDGIMVRYSGEKAPEGGFAGTLTFAQNSLVFQIGGNAGQTTSVSMKSMRASQLGTGAHNESGFSSLTDANLTSRQGATDSIRIIDKAIEQVAVARGEMGAFQRNSVESNLNYLRIAHENVLSSESVIRDADIAKEMAAFTRNQIMVESSTAMLAQANQQHMNVLNLVR